MLFQCQFCESKGIAHDPNWSEDFSRFILDTRAYHSTNTSRKRWIFVSSPHLLLQNVRFWFSLKFRAGSPLILFLWKSVVHLQIHNFISSSCKYCGTRKKDCTLFGTEDTYLNSNSFNYFPCTKWLPFTSHWSWTFCIRSCLTPVIQVESPGTRAHAVINVMIKGIKVQPFMSLPGSISELPKLWNILFILCLIQWFLNRNSQENSIFPLFFCVGNFMRSLQDIC